MSDAEKKWKKNCPQYMACCLPVVASPVGVNTIIVTNGKNGYLANTQEEWVNLLSKLCISKSLRYNLGQNGFRLVQRSYSLEVYGPKFALLFKNI